MPTVVQTSNPKKNISNKNDSKKKGENRKKKNSSKRAVNEKKEETKKESAVANNEEKVFIEGDRYEKMGTEGYTNEVKPGIIKEYETLNMVASRALSTTSLSYKVNVFDLAKSGQVHKIALIKEDFSVPEEITVKQPEEVSIKVYKEESSEDESKINERKVLISDIKNNLSFNNTLYSTDIIYKDKFKETKSETNEKEKSKIRKFFNYIFCGCL